MKVLLKDASHDRRYILSLVCFLLHHFLKAGGKLLH